MFPINVVEKETNISKYLLRMWERRYSFPRPERDQKGERVYTSDDIEKLKLVKRLMEEGYRPSKIIDQPLAELRELSKTFSEGKMSSKAEMVVLVTVPELQQDVLRALENHHISKIIMINDRDDIQKLNLH